MPSSQTVDPTQLNLTSEELSLLRQGQTALAHGGGGGSSSSRAASRASSHGLFMLDQNSLAALEVYFERVMAHIEQQLNYLMEQSQVATQVVYDQTGQMLDNADEQIRRFHEINEQIDELELDFDKIGHIREIVRDIRQRLEEAERELESSHPSSRHREHREHREHRGHREHREHRHRRH